MNEIHPTAIIESSVILGKGNKILPYTIIQGDTIIGDNNVMGPHAVIGVSPTDTKNTNKNSDSYFLKIGSNNIIREFCVIEQACYENKTIIGDNVFMMQGVHISHDVMIQNQVVLTNSSVIAGIVKILEGANIAMGCTVNQYIVIGHYSIVATNAACMKNVKPFSRYIPQNPLSVNKYAIKKFGFESFEEEITNYVLQDIMPSSPPIKKIIDEFNYWVQKYGKATY